MSRVAVYVQDLRSTGVVRNALAIAGRLAREHDVTVIAGDGHGLFAEAAAAGPYNLLTLRPEPQGRMPRLNLVRPLRAALRSVAPDLLLSRGTYGHMPAFLASRGLDCKRVYVISNEVSQRGGGLKLLGRKAAARTLLADSARLVIVGRLQAEDPLFARAVRSGRAVHIPNGIDLDAARSAATERASHPWFQDRSAPVALAVGRIHRQKNYEGLVRALALVNRRQKLRLIVLGGGSASYRAELEQLASAEGVADRIDFAGEASNVHGWLARADLFALPSLWEGSSMALLEALAAGVPVVAAAQAGDARHVLDGGRYGALVDAADPTSIADGLVRQVGPEAVLPGARAADFSLERTLDLYARLVDDVAAGRPASAVATG